GSFHRSIAKKNRRTFTNSDSAPRRLHDQQRDRRFRHSAKVTIALLFDSGARPKLPRSTGVKQKQHRQGMASAANPKSTRYGKESVCITSKIKQHIKLLMARHPRACLGGEHFLVVWRQAQLYSLPVPRSWPLEKPKADQTSTRATLLFSGSPPQRKFSKPISGFSTTNSPEFRTVRNQVALEISLTTTLWRNSMRTWISTSTTTPKMSGPISL